MEGNARDAPPTVQTRTMQIEDEDTGNVIEVVEGANSWRVDFDGSSEQFSSRADARRHAHTLGRANPGTPIVTVSSEDDLAAPIVRDAVPTSPPPPAEVPDGATFAGPNSLGRSALVEPGATVPAPWTSAPRRRITAAALEDQATLVSIRQAFTTRTRVVYELDSTVAPPAPERVNGPVHEVDPLFECTAENAWTLLTANSVDLRGETAIFAPLDRAVELGARVLGTDEGDVVLPSGHPAFLDGGPLDLSLASDQASTSVIPALLVEQGRLGSLSTYEPDGVLAADQRAAVVTPQMAARIIAPAGSGKTRVLTERARLLGRSGIPSAAMALVSFNARAQREMAERTADLPNLTITTVNALGLAIVNGTRGFKATGPTRQTTDERTVRGILERLADPPKKRNTDPIASYLEALSLVRLGLQDPVAVEESYDGEVEGFAELFPLFRATLAERGLLDFDEQIYRAIEILLEDPEARQHAQRQCRVLLVDEFQDLQPAHVLLLRLLNAPRLDLYGVGDDDQTIYGYAGASPRWLVDFCDLAPGAAIHALEVNYRCPPAVVAAASNTLTRNAVRVPKTILPGPSATFDEEALSVVASSSPTRATLDAVAARLANGADLSSIVVLARVNALLVPIAIGLRGNGVAVNAEVPTSLLEGTGAKAAMAWLALAVAGDRLPARAIEAALVRPSRGLSPRIKDWVVEKRSVAELEFLARRLDDPKAATKVAAFAADLAHLQRLAEGGTASTLLSAIRGEIGLDDAIAPLDRSRADRNKNGHLDDLRALSALAELHDDPTTFASWIRDGLKAQSDPAGVQLSTIHRVKGLEWPHVILHDASMDVLPHRLSSDLAEERRIFHVAMTRAQTSLVITTDVTSPSLFLDELAAPHDPRTAPAAAPAGAAQAGRAVQDRAGRVGNGAPPSGPAFEALKAWRLEKVRESKKPAYTVFNDATLGEIAANLPRDEAELATIRGVGPSKLELYADEVLAICDSFRP